MKLLPLAVVAALFAAAVPAHATVINVGLGAKQHAEAEAAAKKAAKKHGKKAHKAAKAVKADAKKPAKKAK